MTVDHDYFRMGILSANQDIHAFSKRNTKNPRMLLTRKLGSAIVKPCQENLAREIGMTREEILEKSQNENKGMDFADIETSKNCMSIGCIVTVSLVAIVTVVNALAGKPDFGGLFATMSGLSVVFFAKYAKLRKRHELVCAIMYCLGAVFFVIGWIFFLIKG